MKNWIKEILPGLNGNSEYEKACEALKSCQYQDALESFNDLIDSDTLSEDQRLSAHIKRGFTYIQLKKYESAQSDFDFVVSMNNRYTIAYYYRGITKMRLGRYMDAIEDFTKAISLNRRKVSFAYHQRANARLKLYNESEDKLGLLSKVRMDLDRALKIKKDIVAADVYCDFGIYWELQRKLKEATDSYSRAIKQNPNFKKALFRRALSHMRRENYEPAIDDLNKIIKLYKVEARKSNFICFDSRYAWANHYLGLAKLCKGRSMISKSDFRHGIEINEYIRIAHSHNARITKDPDEIEKVLEDLKTYILRNSPPVEFSKIPDKQETDSKKDQSSNNADAKPEQIARETSPAIPMIINNYYGDNPSNPIIVPNARKVHVGNRNKISSSSMAQQSNAMTNQSYTHIDERQKQTKRSDEIENDSSTTSLKTSTETDSGIDVRVTEAGDLSVGPYVEFTDNLSPAKLSEYSKPLSSIEASRIKADKEHGVRTTIESARTTHLGARMKINPDTQARKQRVKSTSQNLQSLYNEKSQRQSTTIAQIKRSAAEKGKEKVSPNISLGKN